MNASDRIRPFVKNPFYWQYRGRPMLLLGGSVEDNLFQISDLRAHLALLRSVGGNYVRGTMSSRDPGDVWPFGRRADGKYDLNTWSDEYWKRFDNFLRWTAELEIFVQIEVWDRFDFARDPWQDNPFNPKNNVNYTAEQSGLKERIDTHPGQRENAFFRTIPELENNPTVLRYQHAFVDRMLADSLKYGHVLYCMDNETNEPPAWGAYWSNYLRARAHEAGVEIHTTEMWDQHDILHPMHEATWKQPQLYSFCDISQNNHQQGQRHYDRAVQFRKQIQDSGRIRPINTVKTYGANTGRYGTTRDGIERFWRHLFAGLASVRFHRPPSGIGLSAKAQTHIRSARMLADAIDIFTCQPMPELLKDRSANEAYCLAHPGVEYAIFFPDGGDVRLDITATPASTPVDVRWLDIAQNTWREPAHAHREEGHLRLTTPGDEGYWAALVQAAG